MKKLTGKLFREYTTLSGLKFYAFVATAALGNSQVQKTPYRLLLARAPVLVKVGDLVKTQNGEMILLLEHPSDNSWGKNFKAAHAVTPLRWVRPTVRVDEVTGFKTNDTMDKPMGVLYINYDTPIDDMTLGLNEVQYRFLTGSDVRVRDKVGDKIVQKVTQVLGVNLVYAS